MAGPTSPTKIELRSGYEEEVWESEAYQNQLQYYKDLLTSSGQFAQQQYQETAQTAAEQASYDISGAYANYLKQQRNVLNQGQLESGHKEELGSALLSSYGGAYQQARAEQAKTTASAASEYAQNLSYAQQTYQKNYEALQKSAQQEATLMANIFKKAEEDIALLDQTGFKMYDTNTETGELELTPWGIEQFRSYLLKDESFKHSLESAKMEDELAYYLSKSQDLHSNLFGFSETDYGSEETQKISKEAKLGTKGYIESVSQPTLNFSDLDYSSIQKYAEELGLNNSDIKYVMGHYNLVEILDRLKERAIKKYVKE